MKTKAFDEKGTDVSMIITDRLCYRSAAPRDVVHPPPIQRYGARVRPATAGKESGPLSRSGAAVNELNSEPADRHGAGNSETTIHANKVERRGKTGEEKNGITRIP